MSFINQYELNEINYPEEAKDWKKFETYNKKVNHNFLFSLSNKKNKMKMKIFF